MSLAGSPEGRTFQANATALVKVQYGEPQGTQYGGGGIGQRKKVTEAGQTGRDHVQKELRFSLVPSLLSPQPLVRCLRHCLHPRKKARFRDPKKSGLNLLQARY